MVLPLAKIAERALLKRDARIQEARRRHGTTAG